MSGYVSIKSDVIRKLEENFSEMKEMFGIQQLRLFGSVARGEDTESSDIDLLYAFLPETETYDSLLDLHDYLVSLFGREVDLVSEEWSQERFLKSALRDACTIQTIEAVAP